ncbi:hypothetical protein [Desertivirga xinjiangensis]|uniref:hypothetical protein n=1 Tax=Desertivirga xinjiangensis TaxID=539206 RepID=UPI00210BAD28|nr:hypothetical protein [Pedobacter xinjiangensis]
MSFKRKYFILVPVIVGLLWMIKDSFTQPGTSDLKGNFEELDFKRNEQNTGPVIRIYAVSVADTLWNEMEQYGKLMPHTKYGTTRVFFFKRGNFPKGVDISLDGDNINNDLKRSCLARYEKNAMGQTFLSKYPFSIN